MIASSRAHDAGDDIALALICAGAAWDLPLAGTHGVTALHLMAANGRTRLLETMARTGPAHRARDWPDY
ncbi:hypothetical protein Ct61P_15406 [Colletotrichum tofieldiae]|nr:hypothetical protein Ct61P_15406 [Colletotrichum tofieldiae]